MQVEKREMEPICIEKRYHELFICVLLNRMQLINTRSITSVLVFKVLKLMCSNTVSFVGFVLLNQSQLFWYLSRKWKRYNTSIAAIIFMESRGKRPYDDVILFWLLSSVSLRRLRKNYRWVTVQSKWRSFRYCQVPTLRWPTQRWSSLKVGGWGLGWRENWKIWIAMEEIRIQIFFRFFWKKNMCRPLEKKSKIRRWEKIWRPI